MGPFIGEMAIVSSAICCIDKRIAKEDAVRGESRDSIDNVSAFSAGQEANDVLLESLHALSLLLKLAVQLYQKINYQT